VIDKASTSTKREAQADDKRLPTSNQMVLGEG